MAVSSRPIHLCDQALMEAAQVGKAGQGVAARAHAELTLELAQTPMSVSELLFEQPALLIAVAEHG
jgi:hypothetical protein